MSIVKEITILALTKMHGGVCTAGIDAAGHWVRPVRSHSTARQSHVSISDYSLLPLDFFHGGQAQLVNLGVTRCWFAEHKPQAPHIEDWLLDLTHKPQLLSKLADEEQAQFLAAHAEDDLATFKTGQHRSLILLRPQSFSFSFGWNQTGDDVAVRAALTCRGETWRDIGCTDLRMRALGRKLLANARGAKCALTEADFKRQNKQTTYLAIGLSRLFQDQHWPILVGVHTLPELAVEIDYAKL